MASQLDPPFKPQTGDYFRMVIDKLSSSGKFSDDSEIRTVEFYRSGQAIMQAVRYKGRYFNEKGYCLRREFLRVPLHYQFVSSQFLEAREHPILGGLRPHRGVDLAAPPGTPVWTIADGRVVYAGWLNGYGRTVVIRHAYGYETLYAHLSRISRAIARGRRVQLKQVIGFVGSSGLSTGPHLHFGLNRDGSDRDPLTENYPRERITEKEEFEQFKYIRDAIGAILDQPDPCRPLGDGNSDSDENQTCSICFFSGFSSRYMPVFEKHLTLTAF